MCVKQRNVESPKLLTTEKYVLEREGEEENFLKVEILFDDDLQIPALVFSFSAFNSFHSLI